MKNKDQRQVSRRDSLFRPASSGTPMPKVKPPRDPNTPKPYVVVKPSDTKTE